MSDKALLGAADIAEILGVSKSKAYTIIREGNQELKSMHKLVIS
jgi:DNA-directed RNA polymerase specialized sigma24 family protein